MREEVRPGRREGVGWRRRNRHVHGEGPTQGCGGQGTRGAYIEHAVHGCDAGGVPAGNVRVEILHAREEPAHVGDGRDIPIGDEAVRRSGGSRVDVVSLDRHLQEGLALPRSVAPPQPRCQHQHHRGAIGAARQAMAGGTRKTIATLVHLSLLLLGLLRSRCTEAAGGEGSGGGGSRRLI